MTIDNCSINSTSAFLLIWLVLLLCHSLPGPDFSTLGNPGLGLQLSLSDFGSEAQPPSWLAKDIWENIMALSVLPGPLDNLCVKVAEDSEGWSKWFSSETPEKMFHLVQSSSEPPAESMTTSDENGTNQQSTQ